MTPAALGAATVPGAAPALHPLERSDRLAEQATEAVGLLERFGELVTIALEAVGGRDDVALQAALAERERLLSRLEPLLAALAEARATAAGPNARAAMASILRPVDQALRYAQLLHLRLTDEVTPPVSATDARPALSIVR